LKFDKKETGGVDYVKAYRGGGPTRKKVLGRQKIMGGRKGTALPDRDPAERGVLVGA